MVDIPTLNKSVNEFRRLIKSNNERTQRVEDKKKKADEDAQKKLVDSLKEVEDKIADLPAAQKKADLEMKASGEKLKALEEKLVTRGQKTSEKKLDTLRKRLEKQGKSLTESAAYQKQLLDFEKKKEKTEEALLASTTYQKQLLDFEDKKEKADKDAFAQKTTELTEQRISILDQQDDREKQRVRDQEMKTLSIKTLGISERRFETQKRASDEAKGARDRLNDLKTLLESQGIDIKENKNFQKLQAEVEKKERKAQLKAMTPASELKERAKDSATYLKGLLGKYLGPNSKIGGLLFSIAGNLKSKVTGAISSLFGLLKTGALVAGLAALLVFLDSQYWKDLKADIIPKLEAGFKRLKASIDAITQAFVGPDGNFETGIREIFVQIFGKDSKVVKSVEKILESIFGENGSFGSGIKTLLKETIGLDIDAIREKKWYKGIKFGLGLLLTTFKGIGTGLYNLYDLITPPYFEDKDGNKYTAKELAGKVFSAITGLVGGLIALAFFFRPAKMFMLGGKLLYKLGKWTIFKPMQTAFAGIFTALGALTTQADNVAAQALAGAAKGVGMKPVKGATYKTASGKTVTFTGKDFVDKAGKKIKGAAATQLMKGITSGAVTSADPVKMNKMKIFEKFPSIKKLFTGPLKLVLRAVPLLGTLLTVGEGARILLSDSPKEDKIQALGGLLGGTLGASGLSIVMGLAGTAVGGPIGTVLGGIAGGALGFFAGDYVGRQLASFLLGEEVEAPPQESSKKFSARTGGAPGANFQQTDVAKKARGQADTQQVVDLYNSVFKSNVPDANFTQLPNMNFGNVIPVGSDMATRTAAAAGTGSMGEGQVLINYQPKNTSNQINSQNRTVVNPLDIILVDGF